MTSTKRLLGWMAGGLAVLTVFLFGFAMAAGNRLASDWWMPHMWGGWGGMGGWGTGMMLVGILWMVLFVALPAVLVYVLVNDQGVQSDPAMETLREQYARGDIDEEEYESRRRRLSGQ